MLHWMLLDKNRATWLSRGSHHEIEVSTTTNALGAALLSVF